MRKATQSIQSTANNAHALNASTNATTGDSTTTDQSVASTTSSTISVQPSAPDVSISIPTDAPLVEDLAERAASDASPSIAGTYELLENIMINLPRRDLLVSRRISTSFRDVHDRSLKVKERLRLPITLPPRGEKAYLILHRTGPFGMVRVCRTYLASEDHFLWLFIYGFRPELNNHNAEASWRSMPLILPSESEAILDVVYVGNPARKPIQNLQRALHGSITLGKLADKLVDYFEDYGKWKRGHWVSDAARDFSLKWREM